MIEMADTVIHPTAIVEPGATIGRGARIGPYCLIGPEATLGDGVVLESHVVIAGLTAIGAESRIFPFATIGHRPQDMKYAGERSRLEIGAGVTIRENVTINPGTSGGGMLTSIGDRSLLMACAHVAHDCRIGHDAILVNNVLLGGHVEIGDFAIVGGGAAVHQFVRIGQHAMIGGMSGVEQDVIPYGSVIGNRAHLAGLNLIGLKRRGFTRDDIHTLRNAYRLLFAQEGTLQERLDDVAEMYAQVPVVMEIVAFMRAASNRGLCQPPVEHG
jgi:UDP-N-acetylglucosamine acyltransferase